MKRSNRLVLLIGVFLASSPSSGSSCSRRATAADGDPTRRRPTAPTVVAVADIPLGLHDHRRARSRPSDARRRPRASRRLRGRRLRSSARSSAQPVTDRRADHRDRPLRRRRAGRPTSRVPAGLRAIAVQVDQVTGVGTVIKTGDYVDMVVGFTGGQVPGHHAQPERRLVHRRQPASTAPASRSSSRACRSSARSSRRRRPPSDAARPPAADGRRARPSTASRRSSSSRSRPAGRGHQVRPAGRLHPLVLRSAGRLPRPSTGSRVDGPSRTTTTGIILKTLVDTYGVLPPELVETVLPAQAAPVDRTPSRSARPARHDPRRDGRDGPPVPRPSPSGADQHHDHPDLTRTRARPPDGRPDPRPHRRRHPGDPRPPHEAARLRERHRRGRRRRVRRARRSSWPPRSARTSS